LFEAVGAVIAAVIKTGVPVYVAALIASAVLLFLPDSIAQQIGVTEFRQLHRGYLGGAFVASISLLAAYGLSATSHVIGNRLDDRRLRRLTLETLGMLTSDEKLFLRAFIIEGQNTVHAPISDGVSGGLVAKRIVYRSSNIIERFAAPFNLQPIARTLLTENPRLLD
jgi:hypothetical protein